MGDIDCKAVVKKVYKFLNCFGIDIIKGYQSLKGIPFFIGDFILYKKLSTDQSIEISGIYPILNEKFLKAGSMKGHYFHQDLWAAKKIFDRGRSHHVDIGSRIDGFIAHLLVFMTVDVIDIRPLDSPYNNLRFIQDDATELKQFPDNSIESISSLHAAEHFGLGRYGDAVEPNAHMRFMRSLARVLKPGGRLYFSVPVGKERVEFNAHRVFSPSRILDAFKDISLIELSGIKDDGNFYPDCSPNELERESYACGLFEFTKPVSEDKNN